jgi:Asp-tRNA(Asn)/Glu-tRNA(Gln) amidotransferase A subunit family amidase
MVAMGSSTSPSIPAADRRAEALANAERRQEDELRRVRGASLGADDRPDAGPRASRPVRAWPGAAAVAGAPSRQVDLLERGLASSAELVDAALERIALLDGRLRAWATVDADGARAAAARSDLRAADGRRRSRLDGLPIGLKDLIDTKGLRTTYGSPIFRDHVPDRDAQVVSRLRRAGAVIIGKTISTEFATFDPGPTRNPWNETHTPGGSSSGSAAAVAAGMVPAAIGTQTGGSTIRPASYCGVVGYIPSPGWIDRSGILPCSWSLDRVGLFGGSVADVSLVLEACLRGGGADPRRRRVEAWASPAPGTVGILEALVERASPAMQRAVRGAADLLAGAGWSVAPVTAPDLDVAHAAHFLIMRVEIAAAHGDLYDRQRASFGPQISALVETGRRIAASDYVRALRLRGRIRAAWDELLGGLDMLLVPAAVGEAEASLETIGDPVMNLFATFGGLPAITVPAGLGDRGLPLGVQLIAGPDRDAELLAIAARTEALIAFVRPELPVTTAAR